MIAITAAWAVVSAFLKPAMSLIGGFFNSLWSTELGRIIVIAASVFFASYLLGWRAGHRGVEAAVAMRDVQWEHKIAEANKEGDRRVEEAKRAAAAVVPVARNVTSADLSRMCRESAACRDAVRKK